MQKTVTGVCIALMCLAAVGGVLTSQAPSANPRGSCNQQAAKVSDAERGCSQDYHCTTAAYDVIVNVQSLETVKQRIAAAAPCPVPIVHDFPVPKCVENRCQ